MFSDSHLLWDFSTFRICGSEVHKAERHAPIELVEPALYASMSRWDCTPEIDAVLSVCLAHLSRIFWIDGAKVRVHAYVGALQNHFLRKLVDPSSSGEVVLPRRGSAAPGALAAPKPRPPVCAFMLGTSPILSPKSDSSLSTAAISWALPCPPSCVTGLCPVLGLNAPFEQNKTLLFR